jgi:GWxTD domain-containing protein
LRASGTHRATAWSVGCAAAVVALAPRVVAAQTQDTAGTAATVGISAARFYRASGAQTLVDVFCRIPFALLEPLSAGGQAAYRVAVAVRDSAGLELLKQSWLQTVAAEVVHVPGALATEHVAFATRPGRYTVEVGVTDSATGRVTRRQVELQAFPGRPAASDLLLASALRAAGGSDTVPRAGEVRKGGLFVQTSGAPVLTPQQAQLGYYEELYAERAESATVTLRVLSVAGRQIIAAQPQRIGLDAGGGVAQGVVDLEGLPPGHYRVVTAVATPDSTVERAAEFGMTGLETVAKLAQLARPGGGGGGGDVFASLPEAALDSLYAPVIYLMKKDEQGVYSTLTLEGKQTYLRRFWASRNPTPGSARNEAMERFYAYVKEASGRFREGGTSAVPGWRTDRGRIFIRYGPPDEVLSRPQAGPTKPYEVWKYTRGRARRFIFLDLTQFGNYTLIWTDDRTEPTLPNWSVLLGQEATVDAFRF